MVTRREVITSLLSTAALPLLSACGRDGDTSSTGAMDNDAIALLDDVANNLLAVFPESATSLGIDTGA